MIKLFVAIGALMFIGTSSIAGTSSSFSSAATTLGDCSTCSDNSSLWIHLSGSNYIPYLWPLDPCTNWGINISWDGFESNETLSVSQIDIVGIGSIDTPFVIADSGFDYEVTIYKVTTNWGEDDNIRGYALVSGTNADGYIAGALEIFLNYEDFTDWGT